MMAANDVLPQRDGMGVENLFFRSRACRRVYNGGVKLARQTVRFQEESERLQ